MKRFFLLLFPFFSSNNATVLFLLVYSNHQRFKNEIEALVKVFQAFNDIYRSARFPLLRAMSSSSTYGLMQVPTKQGANSTAAFDTGNSLFK